MVGNAIPIHDDVNDSLRDNLAADNHNPKTDSPVLQKDSDHKIFDAPQIPSRIKDNEYASAEWRYCIKNLKKAGLIMKIYRTALMVHCINVALLEEAHDSLVARSKLKSDGNLKDGEDLITMISPNGYAQMSNEFLVYKSMLKEVKDGFEQFGMTPKAIMKIGDPRQIGLQLGN